ncbi:MAG TPA: hypothetical protein VNT25_03370 [Allosphingosinicella sp.]|nr:hypothetical protein [Allosphingosinicella sp.]
MYLAAVEERGQLRTEEARCPSARWEHFPYSCFSHHGEACCDIAREWVLAMDFAQLNGADLLSGPRWMRQKYEWGPSSWPMHWCEVVERKVIDCGAHAALAHEAFAARGVTAFRAQFVQRYSEDALAQWRTKWGEEQVSDHWIAEDAIYHEGNAVLVGEDEVKLWDASAGWWINSRQTGGYGALAAVRIFAEGQWGGGDGFRWGENRIKPNQWHSIAA